MRKGMSGHQSTKIKTDEWLTPPELKINLGQFDLDPCSPINRPWNTAAKHYNILDDGLKQKWKGRVWCNPPYGSQTGLWLEKLAEHGNGTALIFARTETRMWFKYIWGNADSLLFIEGRLNFYHADGERAKRNAGAPSVLVAYGRNNSRLLRASGINGKFIKLKD